MAKSSKKAIDLNRRRARAMELRGQGMTLEAIATIISTEFELPNYDRRRAFEDVDHGLAELNREYQHCTEELRRQELERLEDWLLKLQPKIELGDVRAIDVAVKISDRRCKLLGLDAPIQLMVQQQAESVIDEELRSFLTQVQAIVSPSAFDELLQAVQAIGEGIN